MDDDASLARVCDGADGCGDVRLEALEKEEVDVSSRGRNVRRRGRCGLDLRPDLLPLAVARLHERHVDDVDRHIGGRVFLALVVAAEVDHRPDAVVDEGRPAGLGQKPDAVRPHDRAAVRLASVTRRVAAQVADVDAAVPGELAFGCATDQAAATASWAPRRVVEVAPSIADVDELARFGDFRRSSRSCCGASARAAAPHRCGSGPRPAPARRVRPAPRSVACATTWTASTRRSIRSRLTSSGIWSVIAAASVP